MDDLPPPTPETETVMEQLTKRRGLRDAWFWVFVALIVVLGIEVWFLTRALYISSVITSDSMKPTLMRGDRVLVRRRRFSPSALPHRGAIVMFRDPRDPESRLIKRVIGLPNEVVTIAWGRVYINGKPLTEPYLYQATDGYWHGIIPNDSVFVMGDNRFASDDSRDFGPVPLDSLEGEVMLRYYPLSRFGRLP
jgi:signal peptidase I